MTNNNKPSGRRGFFTLVAAMVLAFLGVIGFVLFAGEQTNDVQIVQSAATGQSTQRPSSPQTVAAMAKSEPTEVDIPKIGAHSTLVPLGLNPDNTVQVPPVSQPMQAGWYSYGPTPGEAGPAVILGHVDGNKNAGIFYRLKELSPG